LNTSVQPRRASGAWQRVLSLAVGVACTATSIAAQAGGDEPAASRLAAGQPRQLLHCGALVDVKAGRTLGPHTIVVADGRIAALSKGFSDAAPNDRVVDLRAQACTPGWIDVHAHLSVRVDESYYSDLLRLDPADHALRGTAHAARTIRAGFTTVRNLGDVGDESLALRDAINQGLVEGPRIFTAGRMLSATGGHGDPQVGLNDALTDAPLPERGIINSADDAYRAVRQHYRAGADLIKVAVTGGVVSLGRSGDGPHLREDEVAAVVRAARDYGMRVAAHAHGTEGIRRALAAGVDSIEHGTQLDDQTVETMQRLGTWYVPTLAVLGHLDERSAGLPDLVRSKLKVAKERSRAALVRAHRAGVRIALGSDAGVLPHGENAREFIALVDAGLSPMQALQAATIHAATLLGQESQLGSLEPGKLADVVAVSGDPALDIASTLSPVFVMKQGRVVVEAPSER
jgi:imidazolonepropionase-like amidohydrolase